MKHVKNFLMPGPLGWAYVSGACIAFVSTLSINTWAMVGLFIVGALCTVRATNLKRVAEAEARKDGYFDGQRDGYDEGYDDGYAEGELHGERS